MKFDAIITADFHLRDSKPKCRIDNFWDTQWNKVKLIFDLSIKYNCPVYHAGDLFDTWKSSPYLINNCLKYFKNDFYSIIGNHEAPQHNIDNIEKSAYETLVRANKIIHLENQGNWGFKKENVKYYELKKRKIVFLHIMTYKGKPPWPGCTDPECKELFDWFPDADLIVTGHNHKTFIEKNNNQLLINPGSITRQKADQTEHKPCVFLYNAKTNTFKQHFLKIEKDVISREYIEIKNQKDKRINAFIEKLNHGWDISLSFEDNLEKAFQENNISEKIKTIVYEWMGV